MTISAGIRQCALKRGAATCGSCPELETCPTVGTILSNRPEALENLKKQAIFWKYRAASVYNAGRTVFFLKQVSPLIV